MPLKPNILPIIRLAASASVQPCINQQVALKKIIPGYLQKLIYLSESTVFSKAVTSIVNQSIVEKHKKLLTRVNCMNEQNDYACADEVINCFKYDVEMTRLFFEGINLYFDEVCDTFFTRA